MSDDPMTKAADRHDADEIRREQHIKNLVDEYLSSQEDIAFMLAIA